MAWSVGIRCAVDGSTFLGNKTTLRKRRHEGRGGSPPCCCTSNNQRAISYNNRRNIGIMAATNSKTSKALDLATALVRKEDVKGKAAVYENADEWMKESVVEIVRNLREAPLLVHVFSDNTLKTEKQVGEEDWPVRVDMWAKKETPTPEGVIFVEQLREEDYVSVDEVDEMATAWGIVVQGRGWDSGPVCYLLKTSSGPGSGLGLCCTHFCLMRVQSFRETARSQLKNCWLLHHSLN